MLDYKAYGISQESAEKINKLTDEELEYAYRVKQRRYHIEDAERHTEILLEDKPEVLETLTPEDYDEMAERFEDEHDCNRDDNSQWDDIIWAYLKEGGCV